MYKAIGLLQEDGRKLFEVAKSVGYDSDAAFSKAFKRVLGVAPRAYRRSARRRDEVEAARQFVVSSQRFVGNLRPARYEAAFHRSVQ